jgi:hypothetical protein
MEQAKNLVCDIDEVSACHSLHSMLSLFACRIGIKMTPKIISEVKELANNRPSVYQL